MGENNCSNGNIIFNFLKDYIVVIITLTSIVGSYFVLKSDVSRHEERIKCLEDKSVLNNERLIRIEEKVDLIYKYLTK